MMKEKTTYNYFSFLNLFKHWIIFCFLVLLAANPVVIFISLTVESEFYDNFAMEENTEEQKEDINDDEKFRHLIDFNKKNFSDQLLSYFDNNNSLLSFKPDIHLPPPKLVGHVTFYC